MITLKNRFYENKLIPSLISKEDLYAMKKSEIILNKYKRIIASHNFIRRLEDVYSAIQCLDMDLFDYIVSDYYGSDKWCLIVSINFRNLAVVDRYMEILQPDREYFYFLYRRTKDGDIKSYFECKHFLEALKDLETPE